jgi:hypothetical protein
MFVYITSSPSRGKAARSSYRPWYDRDRSALTRRGSVKLYDLSAGCVTPLGVGAEESWRQLLAGGCGIKSLEGEEYQNLPTNLAACVPRGDGPHMYRESDWLKKGVWRSLILIVVEAVRSSYNKNE